jgi:hypothetical protein
VVLITIALLIFYVLRVKRKNALLAAQIAAGGGAAASSPGNEKTHATNLPPKVPTSETGWYAPSTVNTELDGRTLNSVNPGVPELDGGRRVL